MMLALKFFLGRVMAGALDILRLALEHWRIVLPIVLIALLWMRIESLETDLADAHKLHYDYMAQVSKETAERQATLKEQARQSEIFMDDTGKAHAVTILNLQDYYNAKIKADSASHVRNAVDLRSQLRIALDAQAYAARRPADTAGSIERPAGSGGDGNPAGTGERYQALQSQYAILELGCAVTTEDYNTLASRARRLCQTYPCKGLIDGPRQ